MVSSRSSLSFETGVGTETFDPTEQDPTGFRVVLARGWVKARSPGGSSPRAARDQPSVSQIEARCLQAAAIVIGSVGSLPRGEVIGVGGRQAGREPRSSLSSCAVGPGLVMQAQALLDRCQSVIVSGDKRIELDRFVKAAVGGLQVLCFLAGHAAEHPGFGLAVGRLGRLARGRGNASCSPCSSNIAR